MRLRSKILLGFAGLVAGYFAWFSYPGPSDRAEVTDTCSFPTIDNAQYRTLVADAKALIRPMLPRIATGDGDLQEGRPNPPLRDVLLEFLKRSGSTEEAFVRLLAFGRALDARVEDVAPIETFPGPWGLWSDWSDRGFVARKPGPERRPFRLSATFQGPPGLFKYAMRSWLQAHLYGRRYEEFRLEVWFDPPRDVPPDAALTGSNIVDARAFIPSFRPMVGRTRLEHRCPDGARFLNYWRDSLEKERERTRQRVLTTPAPPHP